MIKFSHIMKKYSNITPLKDINGVVETGTTVSIIGPSGTGKSTLLRMVNSLEVPTSGKVFVDDIEVNEKNIKEITKKVGMVFQNYNLFNHLTVIENLMITQIEILKRDKQFAYDKSIKLLKDFGLEKKENSYPRELSGGEKQRVAFARALAVDPEILLLDEPTSALDPNTVSTVERIIVDFAKLGKTVLMVTHSLKLAKEISDKIFFVDEGIIYEEGTPKEIIKNPKKLKTQLFINSRNTIKFEMDKFFDYNDAIVKLFEFCRRHHIETSKANKVMLIFEEVKQILFEKYENPKIDMKINFKSDETIINVKYEGEKFDIRNTTNDISLKIIEGIASKINYDFFENDEYKNAVEIKIES